MKMDFSEITSNLKNKDCIKLPSKMTPKLAEDIGWQIGDGCLTKKYRYKIAGDPIEEKMFYDKIVFPSKNKLFGIKHKPKMIGDGSYGISMGSKTLVVFYNKVIGLPLAPKNNITIPQIILNSNRENKISCIRGIFDTDGTLYFRKKRKEINHYPSIQLESVSKTLIFDLMILLKEFGLNCCIIHTKRKPTKYGYNRESYRIFIEGKNKLDLWMNIIGFKNPKHLTKYKIWKMFGFCPSHTKIEDRINILNGKINPNSFYK